MSAELVCDQFNLPVNGVVKPGNNFFDLPVKMTSINQIVPVIKRNVPVTKCHKKEKLYRRQKNAVILNFGLITSILVYPFH